MLKRKLSILIFIILLIGIIAKPGFASPWAEKEGYFNKTGSKFAFGLKNTAFSWLMPWPEAENPKYKTPWEGFCVGI